MDNINKTDKSIQLSGDTWYDALQNDTAKSDLHINTIHYFNGGVDIAGHLLNRNARAGCCVCVCAVSYTHLTLPTKTLV